MRKSSMAMAATGLIGTVLMMMMSGVYLSHLPTSKDLAELEKQLAEQSRIFLDPSSELEVNYVARTETQPGSISMKCQLKRRLGDDRPTVERFFHRLADSVLYHPSWRRHTNSVTVTQTGVANPLTITKTRKKTGHGQDRTAPAARRVPARATPAQTVSGKSPAPKALPASGTK